VSKVTDMIVNGGLFFFFCGFAKFDTRVFIYIYVVSLAVRTGHNDLQFHNARSLVRDHTVS